MRVELIPSSIPASDSQFLVSFLVNDTVAIDAGSLGLLAGMLEGISSTRMAGGLSGIMAESTGRREPALTLQKIRELSETDPGGPRERAARSLRGPGIVRRAEC